MFTFLNQRYGLRQLIVEWATSLVSAVKQYGDEDAQVHLFGKILKSTVNEDFWLVQETLRAQVHSLVKVCYKERLQAKLLTDVHKHVEDVMSDRFGLDGWVSNRLIERVFLDKDEQKELKQKMADKLCAKREAHEAQLQKEAQAAQKHNRSARADFLKNTETVRLTFSEFMHAVLRF